MSSAETAKQGKRSRWRDRLSSLLAIVGVCLLAYPLVATYLKNIGQAELATAYKSTVTRIDEADQQYWLKRARQYNSNIAGTPILDPWLARVAKDNDPYRAYLNELNPSQHDEDPIAVLTIPSIKTKLPVFHGTDAETLDRGVGHLYGSALPVGGENMHSVLTAHSGLIEATMFDHLPDVKVGAAVYVEVMGETLKYQVYQTEVVLPEQTQSLQPQAGKDLLTLITCTPYGVNTHRLLVHATRVPFTPADQQEVDETKLQVWGTWMTAVLALLVLALLAHLWLALAKRKRRNGKDEDVSGDEMNGSNDGRSDGR